AERAGTAPARRRSLGLRRLAPVLRPAAGRAAAGPPAPLARAAAAGRMRPAGSRRWPPPRAPARASRRDAPRSPPRRAPAAAPASSAVSHAVDRHPLGAVHLLEGRQVI